jgi:single-strand DNA-binding protein
MNALRNSVQLMGNLGRAPEVKTLSSGKILANFSVATSEYYTNKDGEKVQETQWHNVVAWGKTAEIAQKLLDKGSEVAIRGKLVYKSYEDKAGNKRIAAEIVADEIQMLNRKKEA